MLPFLSLDHYGRGDRRQRQDSPRVYVHATSHHPHACKGSGAVHGYAGNVTHTMAQAGQRGQSLGRRGKWIGGSHKPKAQNFISFRIHVLCGFGIMPLTSAGGTGGGESGHSDGLCRQQHYGCGPVVVGLYHLWGSGSGGSKLKERGSGLLQHSYQWLPMGQNWQMHKALPLHSQNYPYNLLKGSEFKKFKR